MIDSRLSGDTPRDFRNARFLWSSHSALALETFPSEETHPQIDSKFDLILFRLDFESLVWSLCVFKDSLQPCGLRHVWQLIIHIYQVLPGSVRFRSERNSRTSATEAWPDLKFLGLEYSGYCAATRLLFSFDQRKHHQPHRQRSGEFKSALTDSKAF